MFLVEEVWDNLEARNKVGAASLGGLAKHPSIDDQRELQAVES